MFKECPGLNVFFYFLVLMLSFSKCWYSHLKDSTYICWTWLKPVDICIIFFTNMVNFFIMFQRYYPWRESSKKLKSRWCVCAGAAVMKSEGFKHLSQSCPSMLSELLSTVAAGDKILTSEQASKKRSLCSSVLAYDTNAARQLRRRT